MPCDAEPQQPGNIPRARERQPLPESYHQLTFTTMRMAGRRLARPYSEPSLQSERWRLQVSAWLNPRPLNLARQWSIRMCPQTDNWGGPLPLGYQSLLKPTTSISLSVGTGFSLIGCQNCENELMGSNTTSRPILYCARKMVIFLRSLCYRI